MTNRFNKSYETSFQAKLIQSLRGKMPEEEKEQYTLVTTESEMGVLEIFSSTLCVTKHHLVESLMNAELKRMLNIKRRRATLEDMNTFYAAVVAVKASAEKELNGLVANYLGINLDQLQNDKLVKHAKSKLGLIINNYRAFRLANFDGKPVIELIFYIDSNVSNMYRSAWIGIKGSPLKSMSFTDVNSLCEHVNQVNLFANLYDLSYMHIGSRGLRYER